MKKIDVAIIGSGPTAIYLLKHISESSAVFKTVINSISIFEKSKIAGMGMPYNPETTDFYNMSNISSEEIPKLSVSFAHWLKNQPKELLKRLNVTQFPIDESKVYSRLALGHYFKDQYLKCIEDLENQGFGIIEHYGSRVDDLVPVKSNNQIKVKVQGGKNFSFSKVIIATGHMWADQDQPKRGYYASPWPIHKYLPKKDTYYNFTIGTLGASLSAFDVVTALAHRHGKFKATSQGLTFSLDKRSPNFKIVMHSAEGWLPHLQYEQEKPIREIYRHTHRTELLALIDKDGFLPLSNFFNKICRPALIKAFQKDKNKDAVRFLKLPNNGFTEFVEHMADKHEYINSFEGMGRELEIAKKALGQDRPTHWMETLDDLMYCLNFHAELLSAEDFLVFKKSIMPFLMNVIAALPLPSANILLALYDAGCIEIISGNVEVNLKRAQNNSTCITVEKNESNNEQIEYELFINCAGQGNINFGDYPFPSLVSHKIVRPAKVKFRESSGNLLGAKKNEELLFVENQTYLITGGIDIDAAYRVIHEDGTPDIRICDISFVHTAGCRPYSYGLQACNATSLILVEEWKRSVETDAENEISIRSITKTYEKNSNL